MSINYNKLVDSGSVLIFLHHALVVKLAPRAAILHNKLTKYVVFFMVSFHVFSCSFEQAQAFFRSLNAIFAKR